MDPSSSREVWVVEDATFQKLQGARISATLQRAGYDVAFRGLDQPGDLVAFAKKRAPLLIVHSVYFAHRLGEHLSLAASLSALNVPTHNALASQLGALNHVNMLRDNPSLDSIICGDPETIATALAECLDRGADWRAIPGLASRWDHDEPQVSLPVPAALDDLPSPSRDLSHSFAGYGFTTIESSRGCYHNCTFCLPANSSRHFRLPYRIRSVRSLVQEINHCYEKDIRLFLFDDDQFFPPGHLRHVRISEFDRELASRNLEIAFTIKCRPDDVVVGLFRYLKQIGLIRVYLGIESGHPPTLDAFGKRVTAEQNLNALALLNELGIIADFRTLLFHPASTLDTLAAEVSFLKRVLSHISTLFDFRELEIYPGTPIAQRLSEQKSEIRNPLGYQIPDLRADLLRRCCRMLFCAPAPYGSLRERVTLSWFEELVRERFHNSTGENGRRAIKAAVSNMNRTTLDVWGHMLEFAGDSQLPDSTATNCRVADWHQQIMRAVQDATVLLPSLGESGRIAMAQRFDR